jgi:hypothetical protein
MFAQEGRGLVEKVSQSGGLFFESGQVNSGHNDFRFAVDDL